MPDRIFAKSQNSALYVYQDTGTPVVGKAYTVGYLQNPETTTLQPTLTLSQTWEDVRGLYLFFQDTPTDEAAFVAAVRAYAADLSNPRFLWISNSAAAPAFWLTSEISVAGSAAAALSRYTELRFENYVLCLNAGLAITLNDPAAGAPQAGFVIRQPTSGQIRFETGSGDPPLTGIGQTVEIPMQGAAIGSLRFELTVAQSATSGPGTEMGALDAGVSFFYDDPIWDGGFLSALTYPIVDPALAAVLFYPTLDPLNPQSPARTLFGVLAPDGATAAQPISTYYRTWVGRTVSLTPTTGSMAGFALASKPRYLGDPAAPYGLAPNGAFVLGVAPLAGGVVVPNESVSASRIMCGLSSVEYVGYLAPQTGTVANLATFYPGKPAYAASFDPDAASGAAGGLTADATTAYVAFTPVGPAAMNYYSQPEQSVFYDPLAIPPPQASDFLDMKEIITAPLASGDAAAMPMAAFAGLTAQDAAAGVNQALHAQFEIKVISQARRDLIQSGQVLAVQETADTRSPVVSRATTRHGMLGFFGAPTASDVPLVQVQLAQSNAGAQTLTLAGVGGGDITGVLRQALQSSQLFLVISDAALFAQNGELLSSMLKIAGIPFNLDPTGWAANGTILVYKYAADSIANLAADLGAWSFPDQFTQGGLTQSDLRAIIEGVRRAVETPVGVAPDPNFLHVYEAVFDPAWNGVLVFNVQVSLADMPSQLAGIAAGIDPAQFRAHHLGINISPMTVTGGVLTMQDTSLFGLINYVDDTAFAATGADDAFKVSLLQILFGNSEIRNFACRIDLLVNTLFGSSVRLVEGDGLADQSVITLNGYYQRTLAGDAFSFSSSADHRLKAISQVLDEVEIAGADFVTLNPDAAAGPGGTKSLRTQFVFSGRLRFHEVPGFDALSFGDVVGATPFVGGLSYANLVIHMDYDLTAQGATQNSRFTFDAQNLAIDMASSLARPQSLVAHFPLKFKGFIQGQTGSTPAGLGYLAAATPITETPLNYPWYGLQFELNLGTFGALASSAGFTATVLLGWSAAAGLSVYTGVKIPGASPENLSFSIEGLLGLSIDDIRFTAAASPGGNTAYTLIFTNLALRVFGLKIPASAYVDLALFGNPDPSKQAASLGWYAAYADA